MDAVDLYKSRSEVVRQLNGAKSEHIARGKDYAEAERKYRIAKAKKITELRASGTAATVTLDLARGDETVANLAFERDCAKVLYTSLLEAINILKKELSVIETDIENERRGL